MRKSSKASHANRFVSRSKAPSPPGAHRAESLLRWVLILLVGAALGCDTDSPTAPQQDPQAPGPTPSTTWVVTVAANPPQLSAGSGDPSVITVTVRRADNGQAPPDGSTVVVSTTLGEFNSFASGLQSGTLQLFGGAAQVLLFAGDVTGSAIVRAQIEDSVGSLSVSILGGAVFFLESVSPNTGGPDGGDTVTITGGGFREPVRVLIGGTVAQVQSVSGTTIRVLTPAVQLGQGETLPVNVEVTNDLGGENQQTDVLTRAFTYTSVLELLQVFSMTPSSGPNEGGTLVTIQGDGFVAPVQVLFGQGTTASFSGIEATVESITRTQIVVSTPAAIGFGQDNRDSDVNVLVRNLTTGESAVLVSAFSYGVDILITSISPSSGPDDGGTLVTIFGQGFDEPVAVAIDLGTQSLGQQPISVTGTEIIFRSSAFDSTGCEDVSGPVSVTNVETGATAVGPIWTYFVRDDGLPRIDSVAPTSVAAVGGTPVTITGANFNSPLRVTLDDVLLALSSVTTTSITFSSPFLPQDQLLTEECDNNSDGTIGERFLDTLVQHDLTVTLVETGCTDSINIGLVYRPSNISCRGDTVRPEASFSFLVSGTIVTFTDTSTGGPTSWTWSFGDPAMGSSAVQNPSYDYAVPPANGGVPGVSGMTYTVTLTVRNGAGSSTASANVTLP